MLAEEFAKQTGFLGSHRHTLAINRIEAAYRIAKREQSTRETLQPFKMPPQIGGKVEAGDFSRLLEPFDRFVDGRGTQLSRIGEKTIPISRWLVAMAAHQGHNPAVPFQRQDGADQASPS